MPKGGRKRGKSHSTRPVSKRPPVWNRYQADEVETLVVKHAKEGLSPSSIGVFLRDQYGIPLTKSIVGKSITQILKEMDLASTIPEDLENLLKKAARLHVHMEKNKKDLHNKRQLQMTEAKIRKLSRYYIRKKMLPSDWKYDIRLAMLA
jgi:small subunit ribosomal protein S15